MAEPVKQGPIPIMKRAAERVKEARLVLSTHVFGQEQTLVLQDRKLGSGKRVTAMALHPAGLAVLHEGKRYVVPGAQVEWTILADDET